MDLYTPHIKIIILGGILLGYSVFWPVLPQFFRVQRRLPRVQTQIIIHRSTLAELTEALPARIYCSFWLQKQRCTEMKGIKEKMCHCGGSEYDQMHSLYNLYYTVLFFVSYYIILFQSILLYYVTRSLIFGLQEIFSVFTFVLFCFSQFTRMHCVMKQKRI